MSAEHITEEEAALYDRQLRLWGVAAQNRMRAASVLVYNFRGTSAEVVKNIVLAGVGSVTLLDSHTVDVQDLGANFFLRVEDVGQKRVEAGAPRARALNPRVDLYTETDDTLVDDGSFLARFDLVVLTDVDATTTLRVNKLTRKLGKKLYVVSSVGMDGWIFADLLEHEFVTDILKVSESGQTEKMPQKHSQPHVPFELAIKHSFIKMKARELKRTPDTLWAILSVFAFQQTFPDQPVSADAIVSAAATLLPTLSIKPGLLSRPTAERLAATIGTEFSPSAAILGGVAGQDVLNVVGGKEQPVRNFMLLDGQTGAANLLQLGLNGLEASA
ncbi:E1 ubiquitin-activating protein aos1 [Microbotryomycetes sp. JL201]|nr:E1 ubiquitin-activating protein aos1 [Microbotryomycetes sp. JL201]